MTFSVMTCMTSSTCARARLLRPAAEDGACSCSPTCSYSEIWSRSATCSYSTPSTATSFLIITKFICALFSRLVVAGDFPGFGNWGPHDEEERLSSLYGMALSVPSVASRQRDTCRTVMATCARYLWWAALRQRLLEYALRPKPSESIVESFSC